MKTRFAVSLVALVNLSFWFRTAACGPADQDVRSPAVAGQFYPSDPDRLKSAIREFLKDAVPTSVENPLALVVPHAGYIFAGQIFADAYRQALGGNYDVIVILGANHTAPRFGGISLYARGGYRTPLGTVLVDEAVASALLAADRDCTADVDSQAREHSIEVQVPFVQTLFPGVKILPALVGTPDPKTCRRFGLALAKALQGRRPLIVASSDLSHYPAYGDAIRVDRETLQSIVRLDGDLFVSRCRALAGGAVRNLGTIACGEAPILVALAAAKALGATRAGLVSYANSGDASVGERGRVVGYGAVALTAGAVSAVASADPGSGKAPPIGPLAATDKMALLQIARRTINRFLSTDTTPLVRNLPPRLESAQGAFVTLRKQGRLRGCIGHFPADAPLGQTVARMAMQAAFNDRRFSPLKADELEEVAIEVSVLTRPSPVPDAGRIRVGRDGVILEKDGLSATFLPQVAREFGWGLEEMLDNLCIKAGLPPKGWKSGARIHVFQAEVFAESDFR